MAAVQTHLSPELTRRRWWNIVSDAFEVTVAPENGGLWWTDGAIAEWLPTGELPVDVGVSLSGVILERVAEARAMAETASLAMIGAVQRGGYLCYEVRSEDRSVRVQSRYLAYLIEQGYDLKLAREFPEHWAAPPLLAFRGHQLRAMVMPLRF